MNYNPHALVFDFDGVLVAHSETFKLEAWRVVFKPYEGRYEPFFDEAQTTFGFGKKGDRYDILLHVYTKLGEPAERVEKLVQAGAKLFNELVQEGIRNAGLVEGGYEVLAELSKRFPMYVNSGTAGAALEESLIHLGVLQFFKGAFGGPTSKGENLFKIAKLERIKPSSLILIGDSNGDIIGAQETGAQLVGLANEWNKWAGTEKPFPLITSLEELRGLL